MTQDDPTFSDFCRELSEFYVDDELMPGILFSFLRSEDGAKDKWYLAVHRFPHVGHRRAEREVVCNATRSSFGLALFQLYSMWLSVRDLSWSEEQTNRNVAPHLDPEG